MKYLYNIFSIYVRIFRFCQNIYNDLYISQFLIVVFMQKYNEMLNFIHACFIILFFSYISIWTKCFVNWFIFRFQFAHYTWKYTKILTKCLQQFVYFAIYDFVIFFDFFTCSNFVKTFVTIYIFCNFRSLIAY